MLFEIVMCMIDSSLSKPYGVEIRFITDYWWCIYNSGKLSWESNFTECYSVGSECACCSVACLLILMMLIKKNCKHEIWLSRDYLIINWDYALNGCIVIIEILINKCEEFSFIRKNR